MQNKIINLKTTSAYLQYFRSFLLFRSLFLMPLKNKYASKVHIFLVFGLVLILNENSIQAAQIDIYTLSCQAHRRLL